MVLFLYVYLVSKNLLFNFNSLSVELLALLYKQLFCLKNKVLFQVLCLTYSSCPIRLRPPRSGEYRQPYFVSGPDRNEQRFNSKCAILLLIFDNYSLEG